MMTKTLQFILRSQIKSSKVMQKPGGFTLIELLVALVIAFLIITPLLGFMVSVLSTDRKEQAKGNSEEEIQNALNYISRDLKQAVYVYDAAGIEAIKNQLRYPNDAEKSPVLVFWKRQLVPEVIEAATGTKKDDAFVYSLVAYYLIKDSNDTWSKSARIARWQIQDGVVAASDGVSCPGYDPLIKYIAGNCPDSGFTSFTTQFDEVGSLEQGMNKWQKAPEPYDNDAIVLTDYIDQTENPPGLVATCPPDIDPKITWSAVTPANNITGFYVCVDVENTTAQVFIRGNALARLENDENKIKYTAGNETYFPKTSVRVEGKGFIFR